MTIVLATIDVLAAIAFGFMWGRYYEFEKGVLRKQRDKWKKLAEDGVEKLVKINVNLTEIINSVPQEEIDRRAKEKNGI